MLNLSILDYPDHADPVKRLTEHVVNKVVSAKSCSWRRPCHCVLGEPRGV